MTNPQDLRADQRHTSSAESTSSAPPIPNTATTSARALPL